MNPVSSMTEDEVRVVTSSRRNPTRLLYAAFASLCVILTAVGFQQFYLHGNGYPSHPLAPPIKGLIIAHGVSMTGWVLLFLVQSILITSGNRKLHMSLGWVGATLAVATVILGLRLPIQTTRFEPDVVIWGLHRKAFTAIPLLSVLMFGTFVALGIANRRKPQVHRPMMLLATLAILAAAMDRISGWPELYGASIWGRVLGPFFGPFAIGVLFLVLKSALTRSFDRYFATGLAAATIVWVAILRIAPSATWDHFTTWLIS